MDYNRKFRCRMISVLLQRSFLAKFGLRLLKPEYFETEDEALVVEYILKFTQRYNHPPPSLESLLVYAGRDGSTISEVASEAYSVDDVDDYTMDTVVDFSKMQAIKWALLQSVDDIELGDLDKPIKRLQKATKVGIDISDLGLDLVADINSWLYEAKVPKVPTGFWHIDRLMKGGLAKGEMGVVLAPPNRGKSQTLINIGFGAAGLLYAGDVIHFSFEMSRSSTLKRYAARAVFRFQDDRDGDADYADDVIEAVKQRIRGSIRVQSFPSRQASVQDLIVCVEQLIDMGMVNPDKLLIITDYADEMRLPKGMDTRLGLIELYGQHRAMANYFNCPVWTASQANRAALSKKIISLGDMAEAFGKAAVADVVIAKCETDEERANNEGRLYMAKIRDEAGAGSTFTYKNYPNSMAMVSIGRVKFSSNGRGGELGERELRGAARGTQEDPRSRVTISRKNRTRRK